MAEGFPSLSNADFYNCVGCIDGILIWTRRLKVLIGALKRFFAPERKGLALTY